ncbi:MAG: glycoside hydrolase family 127 protein, partial [Prevotellaceae bacterium]|nr:glycoside hydrolase family 127 protein [Prevotellaceae bacterium]
TGNYFGMASSSILEPMVLLYRRTADKRYLDFAEYIVAQWETEQGAHLISKALAGVPVAERFPHPASMDREWFSPFNGQKAYEMMSCYEGLLELYKITGRSEYLSAVEKTARSIMDTEINIAGSGSAFECWYHGQEQQTRPTYHTMETCVTVTWLKLCRSLLALTGNPIYADQIELTACNALPAAMKDDASQIVMYSPLDGLRDPGHGQCGMHINCCNANGPRGFALLPQVAVMRSDREVIVNLYTDLSAEIVWDRKNKVSLSQQTRYPEDGAVTIRVDAGRPEAFVIALRIPAWSKENSVSVNGETLGGVTPGEYYRIDRTWKKGDVVRVQFDVRARVVRQDGSAAIVRGPVVLARDNRFGDGFVDEAARILDKDGYVELTPAVRKPDGVWLAFTAPLAPGTFDAEGAHPKQIHFCDFASAGNTWDDALRYRVWIPEPMNVMQTIYKPYDK